MNKKICIVIVLLMSFLTLGFASVATNVITFGEAILGGINSSNFDVYFSNASCEDEGLFVIEPNDRHLITYTTTYLSSVGDKAILNYVISNDSTQYDADVEVEFTIPDTYNSYINIEKKGFLDNQTYKIDGKRNRSGSIVITLTDIPTDPIKITINLEINISAISRTATAEDMNYANPADDPRFGDDTIDVDFALTGNAKLDLGESTNIRLKRIAALANGVSESVVNTYTASGTTDTYIQSIEWSSNPPTEQQKVKYGQLAATTNSPLGYDINGDRNIQVESDVAIYAWYDNGTIYLWSSDSTIEMHPHSERMFEGMTNLTNISGLSHFVPSNVITMRYMFKNTNISSFNPLSNWDYRMVKATLNIYAQSEDYSGFYQICNNIPNNRHMDITSPTGTWNNNGTYLARDYRHYADLDSDGHINQSDYDQIDKYLTGYISSIDCFYNDTVCGDIDGNGMVDNDDKNLLMIYLEN